MHCGDMSFQGKLISCRILTNRALMPDLACCLMSVGNVPFQSRLVDCVVVAYVAGKYQLGTLFVKLSNVSFQCRTMTSLVITSVTLVQLHFVMDCLYVSVKGVSVKTLVFAPAGS